MAIQLCRSGIPASGRMGDRHDPPHELEPSMSDVIDEAIEEAMGTSSKKWALVLLALVVGAALAVWLTKRGSAGESDLAA